MVSIDGTTGEVFLGAVPVDRLAGAAPPRRRPPHDEDARRLVEAVAFVMDHADVVRRMEVRANADTADDAARARRFGAAGVGLCRTEHMFLGPRRELVETADPRHRRGRARRRPWPSCCRCSARTSPRSCARWTACRSPSGSSTRRCTSSCRTTPSSPCRWPWRTTTATGTRAITGCSTPSPGCTSRIPCSGCAACALASWSPAWSPCRPVPSSRPPPTGSRPVVTHVPRS